MGRRRLTRRRLMRGIGTDGLARARVALEKFRNPYVDRC
jgi:hypothetical protein